MSDADSEDDGEVEFAYDPMGQALPAQVRDHVADGGEVSDDTLADLTKWEKMAVIAALTGVDTPDNDGANANFSDGELGGIINGLAAFHPSE